MLKIVYAYEELNLDFKNNIKYSSLYFYLQLSKI